MEILMCVVMVASGCFAFSIHMNKPGVLAMIARAAGLFLALEGAVLFIVFEVRDIADEKMADIITILLAASA